MAAFTMSRCSAPSALTQTTHASSWAVPLARIRLDMIVPSSTTKLWSAARVPMGYMAIVLDQSGDFRRIRLELRYGWSVRAW
jgi:hypothetical protein